VRIRWRMHLAPYFAGLPASQVTGERVMQYAIKRQNAGAANATINRELALLKRMYSLASRTGMITSRPYIPRLKELNVRKGFLRDEQYQALAKETAKIGLWLRAMFEVAYTYGTRRSELLNIFVILSCGRSEDSIWMSAQCQIVELRGPADQVQYACPRAASQTCDDCGAEVCDNHGLKCDLCHHVFCSPCLSFPCRTGTHPQARHNSKLPRS